MSIVTEYGMPLLAASGISLFGLVLAWACWMESRANKAKRKASAAEIARYLDSFKQAA